MSINLLKELAYANTYVINFLNYYSHDILVIGVKKYTVPQIKEEGGPRWNVPSMLGITTTYVKTLDQIKRMQSHLRKLQIQANTYYVEGIAPDLHNREIQKKFKMLEEDIQKNDKTISIIYDYLHILTDTQEIIDTNQELEKAKSIRIELRKIKAQLVKSKVKQIQMLQYQKLMMQCDLIQRDMGPKNTIIAQNESAYLSIKNSLSKALITKKQAL